MINNKVSEIRTFFAKNSDPKIVEKYSRYFREGFDAYGIEQKKFEEQRDKWIQAWKNEMDINKYLDLGDMLMKESKYEAKNCAISFLKNERKNYTVETFKRIGNWFDYGIENWATTDVLCMLVLSSFLFDEVITFEELKEWNTSNNEWKRRAVPVTLVELVKKNYEPNDLLPVVEPLMSDTSEYVQKGLGTLLRSLWKKFPEKTEVFLLKWKDTCGRLIIQYATEKMDKEYRKRFRKSK